MTALLRKLVYKLLPTHVFSYENGNTAGYRAYMESPIFGAIAFQEADTGKWFFAW